MPKYRYIVINQENKQLQGTIGAPDEQSARQELNELGFSIISITQIPEEEIQETATEMAVFEFAAIDKNQKRVIGTIQAQDRFAAYKRLVSEYAFDVEYVIDNNLNEDQKVKERKKGAVDLADMLTEENMGSQAKETNEQKDMKEFEEKQAVLKSQIEFVLNKVRELLDLYEKDMKPDTKEKIRRYVDKILRIKSSTNLDYVRKSAEDLLTFLQKEEIFLNEEQRMKERTKMVVEAKSMMMQLRRSKAPAQNSISEQLFSWRKKHTLNNPNPTATEKILDFFAGFIIGPAAGNEEIMGIKRDIASINAQIWQYIQLYLQSPSPEFKTETKEGIFRLWDQRKKLKQKLKETRRQISSKLEGTGMESSMEKFTNEIASFTGWLLTFYLIYYFISIYITTKDFGLKEIPSIFYIFRSSFIKYFLTTLFLFHASLSVKINFFRRNEIATMVITPLFFFSTLLILLNF